MALDHLRAELERLRSRTLLRSRVSSAEAKRRADGSWIEVSSNDYLGLAANDVSRETRTGAGASRLIHGTWPAHRQLEDQLANWVGMSESLLFSSGYAANVGALGCLARPGDVVFSDEFNHASIIDGCRLSRATIVVYPHLDLGALERLALEHAAEHRWIVTESYFSMDGDSPDFQRLQQIAEKTSAHTYLDEAHSLGVFGPRGAGLARDAAFRPDVLVGTLGKAVGAQGAFVAGSAVLCDWLWNKARSFVFSTAPSPALVELTLERLAATQSAETQRARLRQLERHFARGLTEAGVGLAPGRHGPIFPVLMPSDAAAVEAAIALRSQGFLAQAIRPPTVPQARLRLTLSAELGRAQLDRLCQTLARTCASS